MKELEKIDISKPLLIENFFNKFLFYLYYPVYSTFISNDVSCEKSWEATKNIFIAQETQIGERINKEK